MGHLQTFPLTCSPGNSEDARDHPRVRSRTICPSRRSSFVLGALTATLRSRDRRWELVAFGDSAQSLAFQQHSWFCAFDLHSGDKGTAPLTREVRLNGNGNVLWGSAGCECCRPILVTEHTQFLQDRGPHPPWRRQEQKSPQTHTQSPESSGGNGKPLSPAQSHIKRSKAGIERERTKPELRAWRGESAETSLFQVQGTGHGSGAQGH